MNNFKLHEQAQEMADTRTSYDIARELLQLQQQMVSAVATVKANAKSKPVLTGYVRMVLIKKINKHRKSRGEVHGCLIKTKQEISKGISGHAGPGLLDALASKADRLVGRIKDLDEKINFLLEALGND
jgi:hypothetical protein